LSVVEQIYTCMFDQINDEWDLFSFVVLSNCNYCMLYCIGHWLIWLIKWFY